MSDTATTTSPASAGETPRAPGFERALVLRIGVQHADAPGSLTDRMAQATLALLERILAQSVPQIAVQCLKDISTTHRPAPQPGDTLAGQSMLALSVTHDARPLSAEEAGQVEADLNAAFAAAGRPARVQ